VSAWDEGYLGWSSLLFEHRRQGLVLLQAAAALGLKLDFWIVARFDELLHPLVLFVHVVSLKLEVMGIRNAFALAALIFWLHDVLASETHIGQFGYIPSYNMRYAALFPSRSSGHRRRH
jgi:hypothetical protein